MTQITSKSFTPAESVSLSKEIALIGVQSTPLTSLLLSKGNVEQAMLKFKVKVHIRYWRSKNT